MTYSIESCVTDDPEAWLTEIKGEVFIFDEDDERELLAKSRHFFVDMDKSK